MNRRGLLLGMGSLLAAPAIVRAESLMPISSPWMTIEEFCRHRDPSGLGGFMFAFMSDGTVTQWDRETKNHKRIGYGEASHLHTVYLSGDGYWRVPTIMGPRPTDWYWREGVRLPRHQLPPDTVIGPIPSSWI